MLHQKWLLVIACVFIVSSYAYTEEIVEIQKGDTLYSIAKKYNMPVATILTYNDIADAAKIKIGSKIKIPATYTIAKGDTLYKVAKLYNISVEELCKHNQLADNTSLKVGTVLLIPKNAKATTVVENPVATTDVAWSNVNWPHPGKREKLSDNMNGVAIEGEPGDYVLSVTSGRVIWADPWRSYRKMVMVLSEDNYVFVYGGNQELLVKVGDAVYCDTKLAIMQKTVNNSKTKTYFSIYKDGKVIDPEYRSKK